MLFLCASYIGNKAQKTSGTLLMTNSIHEFMTIHFSFTRISSNTINHTTIADFQQLDFRVDLMNNLLFCYSSHETWNVNCSVAVLSGIKPSQTWFISSSCNGAANLPFLFSERDKQHFLVLGPPAASLSGHKMLNEHHAHKMRNKPFKQVRYGIHTQAIIKLELLGFALRF